MHLIFRLLIALFALLIISPLQAQYSNTIHSARKAGNDSMPVGSYQIIPVYKKPFPYKSFIVPAVLVTYGVLSIETRGLKNFNHDLMNEIWTERPHKKIALDNYLQFAPAVAVYGLNAVGIQGKHNFWDRSMIYAMSNIFLNVSVAALKNTTHQMRPDSAGFSSFPSGHTTEAFASAEFMRMEYKDVSPWYGVAGYAMAVATGYLRMYNNKHYFGDVIAGAGIGIASTQLAYWLYPKIQHTFFKHKPVTTMVMPFYQNSVGGISLVHHFR